MLIALTAVSVVLTLVVAARYSYDSSTAIASAASVLVLLAALNFLVFDGRRAARGAHSATREGALRVGVVLGLAWAAEIGINNFVAPPNPLRDRIDNLFWASIALGITTAAARYAWRSDRIVTGIRGGTRIGFVSGLLACLSALAMIVFGMRFIIADPLNVAEWAARGAASGAPNMAAYFAFETLAGAMMHLVVLGVLMGALLGGIGGLLGKATRMVWRR